MELLGLDSAAHNHIDMLANKYGYKRPDLVDDSD